MDYNKLLEKARKVYAECVTNAEKRKLESVFPELAESEDEKIRKEMIAFLQETIDNVGESPNKWTMYNAKKWVAWLERQDEQKSADKVEPCFKVGDWVVVRDEAPCQIKEITDLPDNRFQYWTSDGHWFGDGTESHLWTIDDAKEGDVLCYENEISLYYHSIKDYYSGGKTTFCGFVYYCCYDGEEFVTDSLYSLTEANKCDIHPATKEQRDLLFQKIKEAGYEWNDNEKVLVGFDNDDEQHEELEDDETDLNIKQNPSWSEEDEKRCMWIVRLIGTARFSEIESDRMPCDRNELIKWLKSLKPQPHWKPTDEQMEDLKYAINMVDKCCEDSLQSLYNDLKKL